MSEGHRSNQRVPEHLKGVTAWRRSHGLSKIYQQRTELRNSKAKLPDVFQYASSALTAQC